MQLEVCELPYYDGLTDVNMFLRELERTIPEGQIFYAMNLGMRATLTQWWETHKENMGNWDECARMMRLCFEFPIIRMEEFYSRKHDPHRHLAKWSEVWGI